LQAFFQHGYGSKNFDIDTAIHFDRLDLNNAFGISLFFIPANKAI